LCFETLKKLNDKKAKTSSRSNVDVCTKLVTVGRGLRRTGARKQNIGTQSETAFRISSYVSVAIPGAGSFAEDRRTVLELSSRGRQLSLGKTF
jgi:hypothetical protein